MNFKKLFLFLLCASAISYGSYKVIEKETLSNIASQASTVKLKRAIIEHNNTSNKVFNTSAKLLKNKKKEIIDYSAQRNQVRESILSQFDSLYFWLKKNRLLLRNSIRELSLDFKEAKSPEAVKEVRAEIMGIIAIYNGPKLANKPYRTPVVEKLEVLSNRIDQYLVLASQTTKSQNKTLASQALALEKSLSAFRASSKNIVKNIRSVEKQSWLSTATIVVLSLLLMLSLYMYLAKSSMASEVIVEKEVKIEVEKEAIHVSNLQETFEYTTYPVIICDNKYNFVWSNKVSAKESINSKSFQKILNKVKKKSNGLSYVEVSGKSYQFNINKINSKSNTKFDNKFLVQMIPSQTVDFAMPNLVNPESLEHALLNDHSFENYEVNSFVGEVLSKLNYLFQLSATTIEFNPIENPVECKLDSTVLEDSLKNILTLVQNFSKEVIGPKHLIVNLKEQHNRLYFDFIVPNIKFTDESWVTFQGENPTASENFLRQLNQIECQFSLQDSRVVLRNLNIGGQSSALISFSVSNFSNEEIQSLKATGKASGVNQIINA